MGIPLNTARASEGGYFAGPTRALIGEGGEPEYIIPESKMRESMARYSRGARGSAVIPENWWWQWNVMSEGGGVARCRTNRRSATPSNVSTALIM